VAWRRVYADIPDGADLDWDRFHLTVTQWVDKFSMEEDQTELLAYLHRNCTNLVVWIASKCSTHSPWQMKWPLSFLE
jgi:hypothetical protein